MGVKNGDSGGVKMMKMMVLFFQRRGKRQQMRWLFCVKLNDIREGKNWEKMGYNSEKIWGTSEKWNLDFGEMKEKWESKSRL